MDKARVAVNREYNGIIARDSTYRQVYDRWSNLMESMSGYLIEVTYGEPYYSLQPVQFNGDIRRWYEAMQIEVGKDREILSADQTYNMSAESRVTQADIDRFFSRFKPAKPGGYNRMWMRSGRPFRSGKRPETATPKGFRRRDDSHTKIIPRT